MGRDAQDGALATSSRVVAVGLPRRRDHARRPRLQLPRRRPSRHPRPAPRPLGRRRSVKKCRPTSSSATAGSSTGPAARRSSATSRSRPAGWSRSGASRRRSRAARVIDAAGKVVCPGFVDPHSHSDFSLLANPNAESTIRQGVTTEVVGNCGWSYAPVTDHSREFMSARLFTFGFDGPTVPWSYVRGAPRLPRRRRSLAQPRVVRRAQRDPALGGCVRPGPDRRAVCADGPLHARGDGVRRARDVDRPRVQPRPRGDDRRSWCG